MGSVLPDSSAPNVSLQVNGLVYQYTISKDPNDPAVVNVTNQDAINGGYVFQATDNWSGIPGNSIRRYFTFPGIDSSRWGNGQISVDGIGTITNPSVVYTYRMDVGPESIGCIVPLASPTCPGFYDALMKYFDSVEYVEKDDPYYNEWVQYLLQKKAQLEETQAQKEITIEETDKKKPDLEVQFFGRNQMSDLMDVDQQNKILDQLTQVDTINPYYNTTIAGGEYLETIVLKDTTLPDNRRAMRSLAADEAHTLMVRSQYDTGQ